MTLLPDLFSPVSRACYRACFFLCGLFFLSPVNATDFGKHNYEAALQHYKEYRYDQAIAGFQSVLDSVNDHQLAMARLIDCYRETRRLDEGIAYFKSRGEKQSSNAFWHYGLGSLLRTAGKSAEAARHFQEALYHAPSLAEHVRGFVEAHRDANTLEKALDYFQNYTVGIERFDLTAYGMAYVNYRLREPDSALVWLERALKIDPDFGDAIILKIRVLRNRGLYGEGVALASESIEQSNDARLIATLRMHRSIIRYFNGEYDVAQVDMRQAQRVFENLGETNLFLDALNINGLLYGAADQLPTSLTFYRRGLAIANRRQMDEQKGIMLGNLGDVHTLLAQYDSARVYYAESARLLEEAGDQLNLAATIGAIAAVHSYQGQFREALENGQRALDIYRDMDFPSGQVTELLNFGVLHLEAGNYFQALRYLNEALQLAREIGETPKEQMCLGSLGESYIKLGRFDEAAAILEEAIALAEQLGSESQLGQMTGKIGSAYMASGNHGAAAAFFQKALDIFSTTGNRREEAITRSQLGDIYAFDGDYNAALPMYERALMLHDQIGNRLGRANTLVALGDLYLQLDQPVRAIACFDEVREIGKTLQAHTVRWQGERGRGDAEVARKDLKGALRYYQTGIGMLEDVRNQILLAEFQSSFLDKQFLAYEKILSVLHQLYTESGDEAYLREAFAYSERARGRTLLNLVSSGQLPLRAEVPAELGRKKKILEWRFRNFHDKLTWLYSLPDAERDPTMLISVTDSLQSTNGEYQALLEKLRREYPGTARLQGFAEPLSLSELQRSVLQGDEALLQYFIGEEQSFVWAVFQDRLLMLAIQTNEVSLRQLLNEVSSAIYPISSPDPATPNNQPRDAGWANIRSAALHKLYQVLIKPLKETIRPEHKLIIVPDNMLTYLPFEMLVESLNGDSLRYLIESHAISYSASASLLNPDLHQPSVTGERGLLALAATTFADSALADLPFAVEEVQGIAGTFSNPVVLTDGEVAESSFKAAKDRYRVLHFATHYLPNDKQPMASFIALGGENGGLEDGHLHAYEILDSEISADMVILSACRTGSGQLARGEGLMGISRAFMYAGAKSLVLARWGVADRSTADFMKRYYDALAAGEDSRDALRQVKLQLIQAGGQLANPFYWAPFVLEGQPQKLQLKTMSGMKLAGFAMVVLMLMFVGYGWYRRREK